MKQGITSASYGRDMTACGRYDSSIFVLPAKIIDKIEGNFPKIFSELE